MKMWKKNTKVEDGNQDLNYQNMFWLFMIANILGVIFEGFWTLMKFGRWETHVNVIWGPFCLIYGIGAVVFYVSSAKLKGKNPVVQFLSFALVADFVEYSCAWLIESVLGMKAWTYHKHFMNLQGRISLPMTIIWGILGITYLHLLMPRINRRFHQMQGKSWRIACAILSVFMVVNLTATVMCLVRWSHRHFDKQPANQMERLIDRVYDDNRMKHLFCEWWFVDEGAEFWKEYKSK